MWEKEMQEYEQRIPTACPTKTFRIRFSDGKTLDMYAADAVDHIILDTYMDFNGNIWHREVVTRSITFMERKAREYTERELKEKNED